MSTGSAGTIRRIPVKGPNDPNEAEERRRKGREYLAKRNEQMYELQQRRKAAKAAGTETPPSPTSFDDIVDDDGMLRLDAKPLPSTPSDEPIPEKVREEMREIDRALTQPLLAETSQAGMSGWSIGSRLANPFGDEYEMQDSGSMTPKPPVPPKIKEDTDEAPATSADIPGSFPSEAARETEEPLDTENLSYEEQLAIALSLSEAESQPSSATVRQHPEEHDAELAAAIAASLREMDAQQAAHAINHEESNTAPEIPPLVDLTPDPPVSVTQSQPQAAWGSFFQPASHSNQFALPDPPTSVPMQEDEDELYRVTPELTRARLATHDEHEQTPSPPYDPVHEAARSQPQNVEGSFYSAQSASSSRYIGSVISSQAPQLVDLSEEPQPATAQTPSSATESFGFHTDSESDSDTFASISAPVSRAQSQARSEPEVLDITGEDSDVDMLSEEGDGVATPDSWTEVGSDDGESSADERSRVAL